MTPKPPVERHPDAAIDPRDGLAVMTGHLRARFSTNLCGIVFYGAKSRDKNLDPEGLIDFYVIVDELRPANNGLFSALGNHLLPPNVYYLEVPAEDLRWRAKFGVISVSQFKDYVSSQTLQPYFWGRLAQPSKVIWARDADAEKELNQALSTAASTLLKRSIGLAPNPSSLAAVWQRGLEASYKTEFRAEKRETKSVELFDHAPAHYLAITKTVASTKGWSLNEDDNQVFQISRGEERGPEWTTRCAWFFRTFQGRTLHILRLIKAAGTFDGGIEYLLWKIERHSGVRVEPGPWTKRFPLLFGWFALWQAKRKGGFR